MIEVKFQYDEQVRKWDVYVAGAQDALEAKQAFNAVVATILQHPPVSNLEHETIPTIDGEFKLIPAVNLIV